MWRNLCVEFFSNFSSEYFFTSSAVFLTIFLLLTIENWYPGLMKIWHRGIEALKI